MPSPRTFGERRLRPGAPGAMVRGLSCLPAHAAVDSDPILFIFRSFLRRFAENIVRPCHDIGLVRSSHSCPRLAAFHEDPGGLPDPNHLMFEECSPCFP